MRRRFGIFWVLVLNTNLAIATGEASEAAQKQRAFDQKTQSWSLKKHQEEIGRLQAQLEKNARDIEGLDALIAGEQKKLAANQKDPKAPLPRSEYLNTLKTRKDTVANEIAQNRSELDLNKKAVEIAVNSKPDSLEFGYARLQAEDLLLKNEQLEGFVKRSGASLSKLYADIDSRLLGQYAQLAIQARMKKFASTEVCGLIDKCQSTKDTTNSLQGMLTEVSTWKKFREDALKSAQGPASGAPAPGATDSAPAASPAPGEPHSGSGHGVY